MYYSGSAGSGRADARGREIRRELVDGIPAAGVVAVVDNVARGAVVVHKEPKVCEGLWNGGIVYETFLEGRNV